LTKNYINIFNRSRQYSRPITACLVDILLVKHYLRMGRLGSIIDKCGKEEFRLRRCGLMRLRCRYKHPRILKMFP